MFTRLSQRPIMRFPESMMKDIRLNLSKSPALFLQYKNMDECIESGERVTSAVSLCKARTRKGRTLDTGSGRPRYSPSFSDCADGAGVGLGPTGSEGEGSVWTFTRSIREDGVRFYFCFFVSDFLSGHMNRIV